MRALYLIRGVEEGIAQRYPAGKMRCPVHFSIGQEGVSAALAPLMRRDDLAVSSHRAHAHYMGKGGSVRAMLAEIYGRAGGCSGARGGSMHLIDESVGFKGSTAIVGNTIPIGVGLGLALQQKGSDSLAIVFLGDGAIEEGVFYESVNFAAVQRLPVLFICENNLYSVYSPLGPRQPAGRSIYKMVEAMGIKSVAGDGNDVAATYKLMHAVIAEMRSGQGPVFAEFSTYRWLEHCGPADDDHLGYRAQGECAEWKKRAPVARYEKYLRENEGWSAARLEALRNEVLADIARDFAWVEAQPLPPRPDAYREVYAEDAGKSVGQNTMESAA
ncbi:MAG: thiamine pyrophosphate-dependent dehydrogenase E1 component subunit alpha [Alphaproteobacteria bacterium]|nr:thiamine pyrophosphate-dependent dehydrogenase E1 component subunit alpha [Alphaproteobacteria bacterium]